MLITTADNHYFNIHLLIYVSLFQTLKILTILDEVNFSVLETNLSFNYKLFLNNVKISFEV